MSSDHHGWCHKIIACDTFSGWFSPIFKHLPLSSSLTYLASCSFRLRTTPAFVLYFQSLLKLQSYLHVGQFLSWKIHQMHYPDGDPWWLWAFNLTPMGNSLFRPLLQWICLRLTVSTICNITVNTNDTWIKYSDCKHYRKQLIFPSQNKSHFYYVKHQIGIWVNYRLW